MTSNPISPSAPPLRILAALALAAATNFTGAQPAPMPDNPFVAYPPDKFKLDDLPRYVPGQPVSGTIRIWGSGYIGAGRTTRYWEAGFRKFHPGIRFEYRLGESLVAVPAVYTGAADIGSEPRISWNDLKAFNHSLGYDPVQLMAMTGSYDVPGWNPAFAIFVHKDNPLARLTLRQLDGIFGRARSGGWVGIAWHPELARGADENLRTWGQLGLTGEWADKPIHVYAANLRYGISGTFANQILKGSDEWNEDARVLTNRPDASRPDGVSLAVEQIVEAIREDRYAIGYSGVAYASPATRMLAIAADENGPFVLPTLETVRDRSYPLADESYMFVNRPPGKPVDPKVREFLRYILSRDGQEDIVRDGKYLPLTAETLRQQLKKLD